MAKQLHDVYNFSYDNLKVLLGGWNAWKQANSSDAKGYPIEVTTSSSPSTPANSVPGTVP
ncbi:MAG: hypothetical protein IVW55_13340 [Chloroflexi bacterium]|nr:hypothetical protein [Chloroflexota bacterium]